MSITEQPATEQEATVAQAPSIEEIGDLHLLEGSTLQLRREGIRMQMRHGEEEEWQEISLARLFPLSAPDEWIAVLDKEGKEIGILRNLHGITHERLAVFQDELYKRYLVPQISRIFSCREKFDIAEWHVETDRGAMTFTMRHPHENMQTPLPGRLTLIDVEGNRYDIPDLGLLDPISRQLVEERM